MRSVCAVWRGWAGCARASGPTSLSGPAMSQVPGRGPGGSALRRYFLRMIGHQLKTFGRTYSAGLELLRTASMR